MDQYIIIEPTKINFLFKKVNYDIFLQIFSISVIFILPILLLIDKNRTFISFLLAFLWIYFIGKDIYRAILAENTVEFDFTAANIYIIPENKVLKLWKKEKTISFENVESIKPITIWIGNRFEHYSLVAITKPGDRITLVNLPNELMAHRVAFALNNLIKMQK